MVEVKNFQLNGVLGGLDELGTIKLRPRLAFRVKTLFGEIQEKFTKYVEFRNEAILEYAEKDDDGNVKYVDENRNVHIPVEHIDKIRELDEAVAGSWEPITINDLEASNCEISPATIAKLGVLVSE